MSPVLDRSLNRRDALRALGALGVVGLLPDVAATIDIPVERFDAQGVPAPSLPLLTAQLAATFGSSDQEWRAILHDAARLSDRYTKDELVALSQDIDARSRRALAAR